MGEVPLCSVVPRRAAAHFRLRRHGLRCKVHVVRLGNGGAGARRAGSLPRLIKLRWLGSAMWRLTGLCAAVMSGPSRVSGGMEPCFGPPFVSAMLVRRAGPDC